jgi:hypothetical protein
VHELDGELGATGKETLFRARLGLGPAEPDTTPVARANLHVGNLNPQVHFSSMCRLRTSSTNWSFSVRTESDMEKTSLAESEFMATAEQRPREG